MPTKSQEQYKCLSEWLIFINQTFHLQIHMGMWWFEWEMSPIVSYVWIVLSGKVLAMFISKCSCELQIGSRACLPLHWACWCTCVVPHSWGEPDCVQHIWLQTNSPSSGNSSKGCDNENKQSFSLTKIFTCLWILNEFRTIHIPTTGTWRGNSYCTHKTAYSKIL